MIIDIESIWAMIGTGLGILLGIYIGWNLYKNKLKKQQLELLIKQLGENK